MCTPLSTALLDSSQQLGGDVCSVWCCLDHLPVLTDCQRQDLKCLQFWSPAPWVQIQAQLCPRCVQCRDHGSAHPGGQWKGTPGAPAPRQGSAPTHSRPLFPTGVLLGVQHVPSLGYSEDPELPGLFHPVPGTPHQPPSLPEEGSPGAVYLLAKQGKSWHHQLWDYDLVRDSNLQLTDFSPSRAADGREYVVPAGGVRAGLCGQALLLRPQDPSH